MTSVHFVLEAQILHQVVLCKNIEAFRHLHPEGDNFVVATDAVQEYHALLPKRSEARSPT